MSNANSAAVKEYLLELQELIVERLEQVDGKPLSATSGIVLRAAAG